MMTGSSSSSTTTAHSSIGLGQQQHAGYQYTLLPVSESTAASATTTTGTTTIRHSGSMGWWAGSSYQRAIVCLILLFVCMQFLLNLSTTSSASPSAAGLLSLTGREMPFPDHRKHWLSLEEMDGSSSESIAGGGRRVGMSRGYLSRADYVYPAVVAGDGLPDPASNSSHGTEVPIKDCPLVPPKLVGRVKVLLESPPMSQLEKELPDILPGGHFRPPDCRSRHRVAIIVPYRDREEHLRAFLHNVHPILSRQQIDYAIFVIEEVQSQLFNRAKLMNIGFVEAVKSYDFQCFIFHDVDLLPEDDRNLYTCPDQPRHMSVAVNTLNYKLPYRDLFGGVSALTRDQMERVNGFSNEFWGWGGEDDDMANRVKFHGLRITRYRGEIARYHMLKHRKDAPNPDRYKKLYKGRQRFRTDGLSNLKYKVVKYELRKLYTWILVDPLYHKD